MKGDGRMMVYVVMDGTGPVAASPEYSTAYAIARRLDPDAPESRVEAVALVAGAGEGE